ncbi:MAG: hypothetical protein ACREAE_08430, partial [Nitrosopumilaceae archaeon]
ANLNVRVEVINAGIAAANSLPETYYIKNTLIDYEPDLFIIYDGWNDSRFHGLDPETKNKVVHLFGFMRSYHSWRTPFVVAHLIDLTYSEQRDYVQNMTINDEIMDKAIFTWESRWIEVCELGKKEGYRTLIAIQPILGTGNKTLSPDESMLFPNTEYEAGILKMLNGLTQSFELENTCEKTVDLRNIFDNISEPVYYDKGHLSDFGNEIVAQKLFELSLPLVVEKPS